MGLGAINLNRCLKRRSWRIILWVIKKMPRSNPIRPGRGIPMKAVPRPAGREQNVMLDSDLAEPYGVETRRLILHYRIPT